MCGVWAGTYTIYLIRSRVYTTWERNNDSESEPTVTFDVPPKPQPPPYEEEALAVCARVCVCVCLAVRNCVTPTGQRSCTPSIGTASVIVCIIAFTLFRSAAFRLFQIAVTFEPIAFVHTIICVCNNTRIYQYFGIFRESL